MKDPALCYSAEAYQACLPALCTSIGTHGLLEDVCFLTLLGESRAGGEVAAWTLLSPWCDWEGSGCKDAQGSANPISPGAAAAGAQPPDGSRCLVIP